MKKTLFFGAMLLLAAGSLVLRAQDSPPPLDTLEKKAGYALGYQLGGNLRDQGATIDADSLARGIREALAGTAPVMSEAAMQQAITQFQQQLQTGAAKRAAERAKNSVKEGAAFLEKNKSAEGVKVTPSGLQYKAVKVGNGQKPVATDRVTVHYEGTLIDGTVFDSSYKRGQPATFGLGQVIRGWTEGLQLMDVGSTFYLYIPAELAYGESPPPSGPIGPNAVLIFKVELLEIAKDR